MGWLHFTVVFEFRGWLERCMDGWKPALASKPWEASILDRVWVESGAYELGLPLCIRPRLFQDHSL